MDERGAAAILVNVKTAESDEASLVRAARDGDRLAFGALYDRYARVVHGIMLAHAPPQHAEDLVQDVFERALQKIGRLRDVDAFAGWLIAIARNRIRDHFRRGVQSEELPETAVPEVAVASAEAAAALAAIRELPEAYRETLMLRLVEGMTGPEIAARVGMTPESVRVNLHRGMKMLREKL